MPDWAIVLVAAFGGGLAGAVLQPVTAFLLQRIRSGEEIRKRREQHLRRMLVGQMVRGRKLIEAWHQIIDHGQVAGEPMPFEERKEIVRKAEWAPLWAPLWELERIADKQLRQMAGEYFYVAGELGRLLLHGEGPDWHEPGNPPLEMAEKLEDLQWQITLRMDELNWPEADE